MCLRGCGCWRWVESEVKHEANLSGKRKVIVVWPVCLVKLKSKSSFIY